jgi:hypothetical protein
MGIHQLSFLLPRLLADETETLKCKDWTLEKKKLVKAFFVYNTRWRNLNNNGYVIFEGTA